MEDAFATPFVYGRLSGRPVTVCIDTRCAFCDRAVRLEVDEALRWRSHSPGLVPLIFEPDVDWSAFVAPTILHGY